MLTTIIAYSIFIANPTGTLGPHPDSRSSPYFFNEESTMREYKTYEECEAVAKSVREDLAAKLDALYKAANTPHKEADFRIQQAKYISLKCLSVERQIDTTYANTVEPGVKNFVVTPPTPKIPEVIVEEEAPKSKLVTMYRIGRMDDSNVFHGTSYNTESYKTLEACQVSYKKTQGEVLAKANKETSDSDAAIEVLDTFRARYACHEILVNPDQPKPVVVTPTQIVEEKVNTPTVSPPVQAQQPIQHVYTQSQASVYPMPPIPQQEETKAVFINEMVYDHGIWRSIYHGSFASLTQCQEALAGYNQAEENSIKERYLAYPTTAGYNWMIAELYKIAQKRARMSCLS